MITIKTIEDKIQDKSSLKVIEDAYKYALEHVLGILRANNMYEIRELDPHNIV